jgi:hypothetical protein
MSATNGMGGVWALQPPPDRKGKGRIITEAMLRLPAVRGITIRFHSYNILQPNGSLDWKWLDAQVTRARRTGRKYSLLQMGEDQKSPWLNPFASAFQRVAEGCALRYRDCAGWHVGGVASPPGSSEEPHWKNPMPKQAAHAYDRHMDWAWHAFSPTTMIVLPLSAKDKSGAMDLVFGSLGSYVGNPKRALLCHHALKLKDSPAQSPANWLKASHNRLLVQQVNDFELCMGFELISPMASNHPTHFNFPRAGTRDINLVLSSAYLLGAECEIAREDVHVRVYPDDLDNIR